MTKIEEATDDVHDIGAVLRRARELSAKLNVLDVEVTTRLARLEEGLRRLLTVRVATAVEDGELVGFLSWGKQKGGWGLLWAPRATSSKAALIEVVDEVSATLTGAMFVRDLSRGRISALLAGGHVTRLLVEANDTITGFLGERQVAIESVTRLLAVCDDIVQQDSKDAK